MPLSPIEEHPMDEELATDCTHEPKQNHSTGLGSSAPKSSLKKQQASGQVHDSRPIVLITTGRSTLPHSKSKLSFEVPKKKALAATNRVFEKQLVAAKVKVSTKKSVQSDHTPDKDQIHHASDKAQDELASAKAGDTNMQSSVDVEAKVAVEDSKEGCSAEAEVQNKKLKEQEEKQKWQEQQEKWRKQLDDTLSNVRRIALGDPGTYQGVANKFADVLAQIIECWQIQAEHNNPTRHAITFEGVDAKLTLLQIFTLMPEVIQDYILVNDGERTRDGSRSWLHETTMDALVQLSLRNKNPENRTHYGRDMATSITASLDDFYHCEYGHSTYLAYCLEQMTNGKPTAEWNPNNIFTIPKDASSIVFFWNHTEAHWTVVCTDLSERSGCWIHTFYNSLGKWDFGDSYQSFQAQSSDLEDIIQAASALPTPDRTLCRRRRSPRQDNIYDCGVIAVYNAVQLLNNEEPRLDINADQLRLEYLKLILQALKRDQKDPQRDPNVEDQAQILSLIDESENRGRKSASIQLESPSPMVLPSSPAMSLSSIPLDLSELPSEFDLDDMDFELPRASFFDE